MDKTYALLQQSTAHLAPYETAQVKAFPWNRRTREDTPRYELGQDGVWRIPGTPNRGKALISCTGDLMCEPQQHRFNRYGDACFFHPSFQFIRGILKASDFAVGNLETTVTDLTPYAGEYHVIISELGTKYHCNAPESYLDALRYAGFDALVNANNHDLDSTLAGLADTVKTIRRHGFLQTGTFLPEDTQRFLLVEISGIRVAILSYATKFNRLDVNLTEAGKALWLNEYSAAKAQRDIAAARQKGAEFVLTYIHWGNEHVQEPTQEQLQMAQELADAGTDIIVGSHSHCLQSHDVLAAKDGRTVPVIYSMGNFVTGESKELCKHTGILQLLLTRTETGIALEEYFIPCYVAAEMGTGRFPVVPTDPQRSNGTTPCLPEAEAFIRELYPEKPRFLPSAGTDLDTLCRMWGTECPRHLLKAPVGGFATDPFAITPGSLFFTKTLPDKVALTQIRTRKALAVISEEIFECDAPVIPVADAEKAYTAAFRAAAAQFSAKTLLIAGREGKTLTKNLLCTALEQQSAVLTHGDSPHPDTGLWAKLHPIHDFYVQEVRPNDPFCGAEGEVCIVTAKTERIPAAKAYLINADEAISLPAGSAVKTFGFSADADYRGENLTVTEGGMALDAVFGGKRVRLSAKLPMEDQALGLLAAFAAAVECGTDAHTAAEALSRCAYESFTQNVLSACGVTLVAATACKSPAAAKSALAALLRQAGRKAAIFGDLDTCTEEENAALRALLVSKGVTLLPQNPMEAAPMIREGDALLILGGRKNDFATTVRKLFGFTDGFLANSR